MMRPSTLIGCAALLIVPFSGAAQDMPEPYPKGAVYVGIHADRGNSDHCFVDLPTEPPVLKWTAQKGRLFGGSLALSPDGKHGYSCPVGFGPNRAHLIAIDIETGRREWPLPVVRPKGEGEGEPLDFSAAQSAPEVDSDGFIYMPDSNGLHCLHPRDGHQKWFQSWDEDLQVADLGPDPEDPDNPWTTPWSLHFTPQEAGGDIVCQTHRGIVLLARRSNGERVDAFNVAGRLGFVNPAVDDERLRLDPKHLALVAKRFLALTGFAKPDILLGVMAGFTGGSGAFAENTVAVASRHGRHQVIAVNGGPDPDTGALVALDIVPGGPARGARLQFAWWMELPAGTASSPAVSADGSSLAIGDGNGGVYFLDLDAVNRRFPTLTGREIAGPPVKLRQRRCDPTWSFKMPSGNPVAASITIGPDGNLVYLIDFDSNPSASDVICLESIRVDGAVTGREVKWDESYAPDLETDALISSMLTLSNNLLVATLTEILDAKEGKNSELQGYPIPLELKHSLVALDPENGRIVWRVEVPESSFASVCFGADGSIYVPTLAMLDMVSANPDTTVTGGIHRFVPASAASGRKD